MFMGRDLRHWAMVAGFSVLGFGWIALRPDVYSKHQVVLEQQFHLPPDVEYVLLESDKGGQNHHTNIRAIVQFTPGQYNNYVRSFDDSALWSMQPFRWYRYDIEASASHRAMTWWDTNEAFHDGSSFPHYLSWGHNQDAVWDATPAHSFCFAVVGEGAGQQVYQCGDYQEGPRPKVFVRGFVDSSEQRLYAYIST